MTIPGRGQKISEADKYKMASGIESAMSIVQNNMREQHNKDKVLSYLFNELQELRGKG